MASPGKSKVSQCLPTAETGLLVPHHIQTHSISNAMSILRNKSLLDLVSENTPGIMHKILIISYEMKCII